MLIITIFSLFKAGGIINVFEKTPSNLFSISGSIDISIFWSIFFVDVIFSYELSEPARFQRALMCKNRSSFKRMFGFCSFGNLVGNGLVFISTISILSILGNETNQMNTMVYAIKNLIPANFKPIIFVGLLAIIFSSADSALHSASINLSKDFIEPLLKKNWISNFIKFAL